ncbi:DUF4168 domain-containing protein [Salipiger bermudensis]|uniref:DUF4168 domain-containing protein n=1 Tax=Salipiger bermudensis TaxID=344736 RepID=UPI000C8CDF8C|nr:DUF4168 domain-containing protein [Salipiger bermudensis]MAE90867.1 hypothetical protein [Pelagibaca sp.]MBN9678333.1 DUF4168 domain-containing protein [Salipiger bermudensis]MCA1286815.1 DUF4168 domain-containing protein [Salipiger bermudensis]
MKLNGMLLKSTVIAALVAAPVAPVMAQTMQDDPAATEAPAQAAPDTMPETPSTGFSEDELTSFVDAAMEVQAVQQDYMAQIEAAPEDAERQALVQEAQQEMANAVEETEGMDVQTYNEIGQAAQTNPELNERILAMLQTRQQGGAETMTE